jgi:xanthine dehydrogenase small subunit
MKISFRLNGASVSAIAPTGTETLLEYLRQNAGLCGTKEGCNEGDCGACSVIVTGKDSVPKAMNACILFLPQIQGRSVRTVEGISGPNGTLHPVQEAMIAQHGAQCGFCTPGFITTMAAAHANGENDFDTALAGNLCRCTGYAPIVRAAEVASQKPVPRWMQENPKLGSKIESSESIFCPKSADELAHWYKENPDATLVAGGTDVGLWVTKQMRDFSKLAFLGHAEDLHQIEDCEDYLRVGATVTIATLMTAIEPLYPSFYNMLLRYGSAQVRNAATIGGNIANGSPIGDGPPALIALGSTLILRQGEKIRRMPIEDYFLAYQKQDRLSGEFVESIELRKDQINLRCYKLSKRFDQDISAVCGCINIRIEDNIIKSARIAFGGMAATPARAKITEKTLVGMEWSLQTFESTKLVLLQDFSPMSDARASAAYRSESAQNMLLRYFNEIQGAAINILEVRP